MKFIKYSVPCVIGFVLVFLAHSLVSTSPFTKEDNQRAQQNSTLDQASPNSRSMKTTDRENALLEKMKRIDARLEPIFQALEAHPNLDEALALTFDWLEESEREVFFSFRYLPGHIQDAGYSLEEFADPLSDYLFEKYDFEGLIETLGDYHPNSSRLLQLLYERLAERWVVDDQEAFHAWWKEAKALDSSTMYERIINAQLSISDYPPEVISFHKELPANDPRKEVLMDMVYLGVLDHDMEATKEYLLEEPPNAFANEAYWRIATNSASDESLPLQSALDWAGRIQGDPLEKKSVQIGTISTYAQQRPEEYQAWLAGTTFFEDHDYSREEILQRVDVYLSFHEAEDETAFNQVGEEEPSGIGSD